MPRTTLVATPAMKLSIAISVIRDALCVNIIMIMITIIILILIICGMPCVWMWTLWSQCRLRGPQATVSLTRHLTPLSPNVALIWDLNCWQVTHIRLRFWDHSGGRRVWVQAVARACADAIYLGQFVQSKYIIVINTRLSLFVKQMFWEDPKYGKSDVSLWEITTDFTKWARYSLKMLFGCMMQKKT